MSLQHKPVKHSYSSFYMIYRRLRYIRYKKKLIRKRKRDLELQERKDAQEQLERIREFRISEKKERAVKRKAEIKSDRVLRKELKKELKEGKKLVKEEWIVLSLEEQKKRKITLREEKKERRKLQKENFDSGINNFLLFLRSLNIKSLRRNIKSFRENAPKRRLFYLISFNSTVLFLLSYFVLFLLSQFITVLAARFYNYPTTVYYYDIYFNINEESWFHDSVKTIFSSGPVINFVLGITFLIIYSNIKETAGTFKLFFLWGFLHSVNMLFGALLVGTLFETGVGHVLSWMYVMDTGRVLFSIISIFFLVISGLLATKPFLISANSYFTEINDHNRSSFIAGQTLIPYLAGNAFLLLVRQPKFVFYDTFILLGLLMSILPILVTYKSYHELYFEEEDKRPGLAWKALLVLFVLILIFRGLLGIGLRIEG
jgi:hypothetical protein